MKIRIIYGKAGCGKTTYLSNKIIKAFDNNESFIVLALTHSAVNNIYQITKEKRNINREYFRTIHSFFRINYETGTCLGQTESKNIIFIDEFSLIDKELFKTIHKLSSTFAKKIYLSGDILQLNPVYTKTNKISFNKLERILTLWNDKLKNENLDLSVLKHLHNNIITNKILIDSKIKKLSVNYRSNNNIKDILRFIYNEQITQLPQFIHFINYFEIKNYILNHNYIFLASKYEILNNINDLIYSNTNRKHIIQNNSSEFKNLYLSENDKILTYNNEPGIYNNNEEMTIINIQEQYITCTNTDNEEIIIRKKNNTFPIGPNNLITVHKSQGRGFDNIIICLDEFFDISMLYTAITRAKKEILFYTKKPNKIEALTQSAQIESFNKLKTISELIN